MSRGPSPVPRTVFGLVFDVFTFVRLSLRSRVHLAAENVFLRKQLALYRERQSRIRKSQEALASMQTGRGASPVEVAAATDPAN